MRDIAMSATGDLIPNGTGGLVEVHGLACDQQDVNYRAKTNDPDHRAWALGGNLEDLVGQPNTAATGRQGEKSLARALTHDGRFGAQGLSISSVPIATNQIEFIVGLPNSKVKNAPAVLTTVVQLES